MAGFFSAVTGRLLGSKVVQEAAELKDKALIEFYKELGAEVGARQIAEMAEVDKELTPVAFNTLVDMAKADEDLLGQVIAYIKFLANTHDEYKAHGIDALKELDFAPSAIAIADIAKKTGTDDTLRLKAINTIAQMNNQSVQYAIVQTVQNRRGLIPQGVDILKKAWDEADESAKAVIHNAAKYMVRLMVDQGANDDVQKKLDVIDAFKRASFPESERNCNILLTSILKDPKAMAEFCAPDIEARGRRLRDAFRPKGERCLLAIEGVIIYTKGLENLCPGWSRPSEPEPQPQEQEELPPPTPFS